MVSAMARKTRDAYRDAGSGKFITEKQAERRNPNRWIKERVPKPGNGVR
jgi:hypothetical protein